jgi:hypothetical protein
MPSEPDDTGAAIAVRGLGKDYRIFANPRDPRTRAYLTGEIS